MRPREIRRMLERYRITEGDEFSLRAHDPADLDGHAATHEEASELLASGVARLSELQTRLYADERWALLAIFQGMDAAGKDSAIKHVMTGVNPQGVQITSFKQPGPIELAHDFLWRVHAAVPMRGRIGVFNRSQYEEVLVARVHPEVLETQKLPEAVRGKKFWKHRLESIAEFEHYLARQGIVVVKFFLNVSKAEQRRRFLARLDTPEKNWKFSAADLKERDFWDAYQDAYEAAIQMTASSYAPWYVVPADHKWFTQLVVVEAMIDALEAMDLAVPSVPEAERARLAEARAALEAE